MTSSKYQIDEIYFQKSTGFEYIGSQKKNRTVIMKKTNTSFVSLVKQLKIEKTNFIVFIVNLVKAPNYYRLITKKLFYIQFTSL